MILFNENYVITEIKSWHNATEIMLWFSVIDIIIEIMFGRNIL